MRLINTEIIDFKNNKKENFKLNLKNKIIKQNLKTSKTFNNYIKYLNFDQVFNFKNLWKSYKSCIKHNNWKEKTQNFIKNDILNLNKILYELKNNLYKPKPTNSFKINERGKNRQIFSYEIRDRIVFKCFCDYYLNPLFSNQLIYDCPASVKHKGIDFAKQRIKFFLMDYFNKNKTNNGFIIKLDIASYFANIDHNILFLMAEKYIKDMRLLKLFKLIIKDNDNNASVKNKGVGLGLGSQLSQISALIYLSHLDHFVKEKLGVKYYLRYMDDFCIILKSKLKAKKILKEIILKLHNLKLYINQKSTRIYRLEKSFKFLKTTFTLTKTGKIYTHNSTKTFSKTKHKLKYLLKNNKISEIQKIMPSWSTYILKTDDYIKFMKLLKKLNLKYSFNNKNVIFK